MSPGSSTESYPAFAHIGMRGKPRKKPQPDKLPRPDIEPGALGFSARRDNRYSTEPEKSYSESRRVYRVLVGRSEGERPLVRPRRRWENNIKMDLRELRYDARNWINLAQDRDRWRSCVRTCLIKTNVFINSFLYIRFFLLYAV
ncbi:hypothetical protein ANN_27286 [Periplaneta americana]|uniref:Uncharacterized protein n=1 Tax=Periplaneta americana TaxID=6978 RepID=A0ABQ8RXV0_PERAM|nr:hypothetical protein ANN_27286 [Periplaneta americana]